MLRIEARISTPEPRLDADEHGEPAIVFADQVKIAGPLVREWLVEAQKLLSLHDLGAVVNPEWRDAWTACEGSGMSVGRFQARGGVTEAHCPICCVWTPLVADTWGATFADHVRRVERVSS